MRTPTLAILLAVVGVLSAPSQAAATTYYVNNSSASCSNTGSGTLAAPYCTISAALSAHHSSGTTIVVLPGVYREQVTVPASGAAGSPITLQAQSSPGNPVVVTGADDFADPSLWSRFSGNVWRASSVTWNPMQVFADSARLAVSTASPGSVPANSFEYVSGSGLYVNVGGDNPGGHHAEVGRQPEGFYVSGRSWVVIDGFTVSRTEEAGIKLANASNNCTVSHNTVTCSYIYGIELSNGSAILVSANTSSDHLWSGIALTSNTSGCTIQDNESYHNLTPNQSSGFYGFTATNNLIQRNRFHDNAYNGSFVSNGSTNNVFVQNRSWNNAHQGIEDIFCPGNYHMGDVSYGNNWNGFAIEGGATGTTLYNCVAVNNSRTSGNADLEVDAASTSGFTSSDNLFWNSTSGPAVIQFGGTSYTSVSAYRTATGNDARTLQADPKFANPAAGDFRPLAGSPLIDSGNSGVANWPSTDAAGSPRVDDPATPNTGRGPITYADRGALEYLPANLPPVASLTLSPTSGSAPLMLTADASGSYDPMNGRISSYQFDFGDGTVIGPQPGAIASHAYSTTGRRLVTVTVTDSVGVTGSASAPDTVNAGPAASLTFEQQPTGVVAGATITPPVTVRVRDASGNFVPGAPVTLSLVGGGTLNGGGPISCDGNGLATFPALSVAQPGSRQLSATSGAATPVSSDPFTVSGGVAATLTFEQQPTAVVAGATLTPPVTVRARDTNGNTVAGAQVALGLVGSGTLSGGGAIPTDGNGLATFAGLSVNLAGSKQLSATTGSLTPVSSNPFTVSAGAAATFAFEQQPTAVVAGATMTPAVTVRVKDAFGNTVPGAPVTLGLVGGGALSGGGPISSDATGLATFASLSVNVAGSKQMSATSGTATPLSSNPFTVSAGAAAALTFEQQPTAVVAGATMAPAVTVRVKDAFGNAVAGTPVSLVLVGGGPLSGGGPISSDGTGLATFTSLSMSLAGSNQLSATSGALTPVSSNAFTVTAGAASLLAFEQQPTAVAAGGTITPSVTVRVKDAFGNTVAGARVTLSLAGGGTLSGGGPVTSDSNGLATFPALSTGQAGSQQLSATSGTATPVPSTPFTVSAGTAATLAFVQQPTAVVAGATLTPAVTVRVRDAFGNGIAGAPVSLSLIGGGTLSGGGPVSSDNNGLATYASLSVDVAGGKLLSATSGALAPASSNPFTVSAGAAATLAFEQQPTAVVAGAVMTPAVTVRVRDTFGNFVAGAPVSLSLVGSGTLSGGGTIPSDGNGLATFVGLSVDVAGGKRLSAAAGTLTPVSSSPFSVSAGAAAALAFEQQPTAVVAGATITPAVTVRVRDALGNGVAGVSVALGPGGSGTLSGGGAVSSDGNGLATFAALHMDLAGSKQLIATSRNLAPVTSSSFAVSPGAATALSFTTPPSNVLAGAALSPAPQVQVVDAFGNGVPGTPVALALVGTGTLTGGAVVASDATGVATFSTLSVNLAGSKQLSASSGTLTPATSNSFVVSAAAAAALSFATQPSNVVAGATLAPAPQVRVVDPFGNSVAGASVALALIGTGALTGGAAVVSDTAGVATFSALSVNLAGSKQLSATNGTLTPATSNAFAVTTGAAATLAFEQQPTAVVAGTKIAPAVTVRVRDTYGNPVPGAPVTLALVGNGTLTGGDMTSDSTGLATFAALSIDLAGSKQLSAASGTLPPVTSNAFAVNPAAAAALAFEQQPTAVVAGGTITPVVTVRVRDTFGNPVPGAPVTLALVGSGTLTGGAVATDSTGLAAFTALSVDLVGSKQLSATSGSLTPVLSNPFTVSVGAAAAIAFVQQPAAAVAGVMITPAVTVRVHDAFGNAVAGVTVFVNLVGTGTLSGALPATSDSTGLATFNALSIDLAGSKWLFASCGALAPESSDPFTVTAGAASAFVFVQQPTPAAAGRKITPAVTVRARDAFGNPVSGASVALTLVGDGTLSGGAAVTSDVNGLATFDALKLDEAGSKQLTASLALPPVTQTGGGKSFATTHQAITSAMSDPFKVSAGVASVLAFDQLPHGALTGVAFTPAVTVCVRDLFGNGVAGTSVVVRLVGTGSLSGSTTAVSDSTGLATFTGLSVDQAGSKLLIAWSGTTLGPLYSKTFLVAAAAVSHAGPTTTVTDTLGQDVPGPVVASVSSATNPGGNASLGTPQGAGATTDSTFAATPVRVGGLAPSVSPNPMRATASFGFRLDGPAMVRIRIFDLGGRLVRTLPVDGPRSAGWNVVALDGRTDDGAPLNSGVYMYELQAGDHRAVGRFVVTR